MEPGFMSTTSAQGQVMAAHCLSRKSATLTEAAFRRLQTPNIYPEVISTQKCFSIRTSRDAIDQVCMCVAEAPPMASHNGRLSL